MSESQPSEMYQIEVAFGLPHKQQLITLNVAPGTTVEQAIQQSGILSIFPEIDLSKNAVGIWNRVVKLTDTVENGDRIEIYRPLMADPKEVRKKRAEQAKQAGRADKVTGGRVNPQRAKNE
jgi:hypothetical protein